MYRKCIHIILLPPSRSTPLLVHVAMGVLPEAVCLMVFFSSLQVPPVPHVWLDKLKSRKIMITCFKLVVALLASLPPIVIPSCNSPSTVNSVSCQKRPLIATLITTSRPYLSHDSFSIPSAYSTRDSQAPVPISFSNFLTISRSCHTQPLQPLVRSRALKK